ncbi:hypothetical protein UVI_02012700 [Ustilaginoidea virens]|uniref:Uncharacterized protein n=1 Tax=Ustilaginoidea virens TaxID=1159556 RepID=A0A1B5KZU1_USTVR|nr:hypothetical protein UVI_02012700 [Ustilaginoidea virens]
MCCSSCCRAADHGNHDYCIQDCNQNPNCPTSLSLCGGGDGEATGDKAKARVKGPPLRAGPGAAGAAGAEKGSGDAGNSARKGGPAARKKNKGGK